MEAAGTNGDNDCWCVTWGSQQKQYLGMIYVLGDCRVMTREFWWLLLVLRFVLCASGSAVEPSTASSSPTWRNIDPSRDSASKTLIHTRTNVAQCEHTTTDTHTHKDVLYLSTDPLRNLTTRALCHCHTQCTLVKTITFAILQNNMSTKAKHNICSGILFWCLRIKQCIQEKKNTTWLSRDTRIYSVWVLYGFQTHSEMSLFFSRFLCKSPNMH